MSDARWIDIVNFQSDFNVGDMYPIIMANQYAGLVTYIEGLYPDLDSTTCDHVATAFCVLLYVAGGTGWSASERSAVESDIRNLPAQSSFMGWVATPTCLAQCDAYKALFA